MALRPAAPGWKLGVQRAGARGIVGHGDRHARHARPGPRPSKLQCGLAAGAARARARLAPFTSLPGCPEPLAGAAESRPQALAVAVACDWLRGADRLRPHP